MAEFPMLHGLANRAENVFFHEDNDEQSGLQCELPNLDNELPSDGANNLGDIPTMATTTRKSQRKSIQSTIDKINKINQSIMHDNDDELEDGQDNIPMETADVNAETHGGTVHPNLIVTPHKCPVCNQCFVSSEGRDRHMHVHGGVKSFECVVCRQLFFSSKQYRKHMETHGDDPQAKPFGCEKCPKRFLTNRSMKLHMRTHDDKSLACPTCDRNFLSSYHLNIHVMTQKGAAIKCKVCEKKFCADVDYRKHLKSSHKESEYNLFECNVCNKVYDSQSALNGHMRVHRDYEEDDTPSTTAITAMSQVMTDYYTNKFLTIAKSDAPEKDETDNYQWPTERQTLNMLSSTLKASEPSPSHSKASTPSLNKPATQSSADSSVSSTSKHATDDHDDSDIDQDDPDYAPKSKKAKKSLGVTYGANKTSNDALTGQEVPKEFMCDICNSTFSQKSHLKSHMRFHEENEVNYGGPVQVTDTEEVYECKICKKCFDDSPKLATHMRSHTAEEQYRCFVADERYRQRQILIQCRSALTKQSWQQAKMQSMAIRQSQMKNPGKKKRKSRAKPKEPEQLSPEKPTRTSQRLNKSKLTVFSDTFADYLSYPHSDSKDNNEADDNEADNKSEKNGSETEVAESDDIKTEIKHSPTTSEAEDTAEELEDSSEPQKVISPRPSAILKSELIEKSNNNISVKERLRQKISDDSDKLFRCFICDASFISRELVIDHLKSHDEKSDSEKEMSGPSQAEADSSQEAENNLVAVKEDTISENLKSHDENSGSESESPGTFQVEAGPSKAETVAIKEDNISDHLKSHDENSDSEKDTRQVSPRPSGTSEMQNSPLAVKEDMVSD